MTKEKKIPKSCFKMHNLLSQISVWFFLTQSLSLLYCHLQVGCLIPHVRWRRFYLHNFCLCISVPIFPMFTCNIWTVFWGIEV